MPLCCVLQVYEIESLEFLRFICWNMLTITVNIVSSKFQYSVWSYARYCDPSVIFCHIFDCILFKNNFFKKFWQTVWTLREILRGIFKFHNYCVKSGKIKALTINFFVFSNFVKLYVNVPKDTFSYSYPFLGSNRSFLF